eukprot:7488088-Pyramimonas_sp.AAC.2
MLGRLHSTKLPTLACLFLFLLPAGKVHEKEAEVTQLSKKLDGVKEKADGEATLSAKYATASMESSQGYAIITLGCTPAYARTISPRGCHTLGDGAVNQVCSYWILQCEVTVSCTAPEHRLLELPPHLGPLADQFYS